MIRRSFWDRLLTPFVERHVRRSYRHFVEATTDTRRTQDQMLRGLLALQSGSAFARDHGMTRVSSYEAFTRAVPVAGYERFAPYVDRVRQGETSALLGRGQRLLMFALTSGTTSQPKYIPVTREFLRGYQRGWNVWGLKALLDHPNSFFRGIVQVTSPMQDHLSPSGVPCGAITGLLAASQKRIVRKFYVVPLAVAQIADSASKYYTIMRLAVPQNVAFLVTANPATLLRLARTADEHKERLIRDIHDGTLTPDGDVSATVRQALAPRLRADPQCAGQLERLVSRVGSLRPRDYWNLSFLAHWTGGTMGLHRRFFPAWFGDVSVRDIGLLASEGRMSVPVEDDTASGVLDITTQFYEFIPADAHGSPRPPVLRCHELREGEEYFLVLTNAAGLCRYDIGDRVRVTGWFGTTPLVEFLSKGAHSSSLTGEKLTEDQVVLAMAKAAPTGGATLHSFVLCPQFAEEPSYRLYVDADETPESIRFRGDELAERVDAALREINLEYDARRESRRLGPVTLAVTPAGFLRDMDRRRQAASSSRAEQFKHQYLYSTPGMDRDWPLAHPAGSETAVA